jgi:hypothetical protein
VNDDNNDFFFFFFLILDFSKYGDEIHAGGRGEAAFEQAESKRRLDFVGGS